MNKHSDDEEESRRLFLLRALFLAGTSDGMPTGETRNSDYMNQIDSVNQSRGRRRFTRIALISQLDTWDCGVACLLMANRFWFEDDRNIRQVSLSKDPYALNDDNSKDCLDERILMRRKQILEVVGTESIWTSDLMAQLQIWKSEKRPITRSERELADNSSVPENLVFVLASQQIMGADESYREFQYYQNAFEDDQARVKKTFRDLHSIGVPMLQTTTFIDGERHGRGMSLNTVIELVERDDCIAIVLLDNCVLLNNAENPSRAAPMTMPSPSSNKASHPPFTGHYVILCGTSDDPKNIEIANSNEMHQSRESLQATKGDRHKFCFVLCNPDPSPIISGSNYMYITPEHFEKAWRSPGTDEDIIFLRNINHQGVTNKDEVEHEGLHRTRKHRGEIHINGTNDNAGELLIDARHLPRKIRILVREKCVALTQLLLAVCKHYFPSFGRS